MKLFLLLLTLAAVAGCATDSQGNKESAWEAMTRWDQSMNTSIDRIQNKTYQD